MAVGLALLACGCTSTQTTAARLQLNDARLRAVDVPVRVTAREASTTVTVTAQTIVSTGDRFTAVVTLENHSDHAVSDLPISVGYRAGRRTVYLNAGSEQVTVNYFGNHIPSVGAHSSLTWVDSGSGTLPAHAHSFARVGATPSVPVGSVTPPLITVTPSSASLAGTAQTLTVHLTNRSSIPQYQLPIYTVLTQHGQVVGGAARSITELAGGAKAVLRFEVGANDSIRVQAPGTIFK